MGFIHLHSKCDKTPSWEDMRCSVWVNWTPATLEGKINFQPHQSLLQKEKMLIKNAIFRNLAADNKKAEKSTSVELVTPSNFELFALRRTKRNYVDNAFKFNY